MVHVLSGQAQFDQRRNTSMTHGVDPNVTADLLRMLAQARARGEEWIAWIDNGCPELTVAEYERVSRGKRKRRVH